ncbi:hypothetical protein [Paraglaciecola arctica]|uniref:hypothetical protein n=1 Tax=Paraglaciecola arctica TaxID=1128911 RepID=UPI001C079B5B|nr:hypothetical protein [Paraglaciecola arctica]MBU3004969.1 hypothetical protein [Paraglaciecola arctica]
MSGKYIGYMPQSQIQEELRVKKIRLINPDKHYYEFKLDFVTKKKAKDPNKVNFIRSKFQDVFK